MIEFDTHRLKWITDIRRDLHAHPELSFREHRTTDRIVGILNDLGIETRRLPESPGAVALIEGQTSGPCLGFRADIDALPIQEANTSSYRSCVPNAMHACGHDANTAIMLGVAKTLAQSAGHTKLPGRVKFIFQPAEEREAGAETTIAQGVLEAPRVDRILAGHMAPDLDVGTIGIFKDKGYAAADLFSLEITGRGGHGGRPHETRDPLAAGAYFVTALQTLVGRNTDPVDPAVVSVGKFRAGDTGNVIPETAFLEGTIRTHSDASRDLILKRMTEMTTGLEATFDVICRLNITPETPACRNHTSVSHDLFELAGELLGKDKVTWLPPTMGSEDFAFFTLARPGAIVRLGCRNAAKGITAPLHSPYFDIDEAVLEIGVQLFYRAALDFLSGINASEK